MDPHSYCRQACAELLGNRAGLDADHERLQRAAVLTYLAELRLSAQDFERELIELSRGPAAARRPRVADAARAILRDWQGHRLSDV